MKFLIAFSVVLFIAITVYASAKYLENSDLGDQSPMETSNNSRFGTINIPTYQRKINQATFSIIRVPKKSSTGTTEKNSFNGDNDTDY